MGELYLSMVLSIRKGRALGSRPARKGTPAGIGETTLKPKSNGKHSISVQAFEGFSREAG